MQIVILIESGNTAILTAAQMQTKAESEGCITYTDAAINYVELVHSILLLQTFYLLLVLLP